MAIFQFAFKVRVAKTVPWVVGALTLAFMLTTTNEFKYAWGHCSSDMASYSCWWGLKLALQPVVVVGVTLLVTLWVHWFCQRALEHGLAKAAKDLKDRLPRLRRPPVSGATIGEEYIHRAPTHPVLDSLLNRERVLAHELQAGGNYLTLNQPAFQMAIIAYPKGTRTIVGHAIRMHNHLVALHHTMQTAPVEQLCLHVSVPGKPAYDVSIQEYHWTTLVGDVVIASTEGKPLPYTKNAVVRPLLSKQIVACTSGHPVQNSSMGEIDNCSTGWGMVQYTGEARQGFCGAAYYAGNVVYGIHTVGGLTKLGYNAQYISMLIARLQSSDFDMLIQTIDRSIDRSYRISQAGLDETQVYFGGRYYIIENEELEQLYELHPYEDNDDVERPRRRARAHELQAGLVPLQEEDGCLTVPGLFEEPERTEVPHPEIPDPVLVPEAQPVQPVEARREPTSGNELGAQTTLPGPGSDTELRMMSLMLTESLAPLFQSCQAMMREVTVGHQQTQQLSRTLLESTTSLQRELLDRLSDLQRNVSMTFCSLPTAPASPSVIQPATRPRRRRNSNGRRRSGPSTSRAQQGLGSSPTTPQLETPLAGTASDAITQQMSPCCNMRCMTGLPPSYQEAQMEAAASAPVGAELAPNVPRT